MTTSAPGRFSNEKYINLESYRKTDAPVRTPVWFAEDGGLLYVYSLADAGKVKRIRNNPRVRVAPCDMRGNLRGDWVNAQARILDGPEADNANRLLDEKYGLIKRIGNLTSNLLGRKRAFIAIQAD
ncbi:MAG TPA: PPOX class F420-dependent oxidoreductase [Blastocatellia bacterium]|jgi:PPOX class probable F420-dependent enzyme|nr:PPOX class F420-dependent oxidoreductase [Blastocatellia bacterium]